MSCLPIAGVPPCGPWKNTGGPNRPASRSSGHGKSWKGSGAVAVTPPVVTRIGPDLVCSPASTTRRVGDAFITSAVFAPISTELPSSESKKPTPSIVSTLPGHPDPAFTLEIASGAAPGVDPKTASRTRAALSNAVAMSRSNRIIGSSFGPIPLRGNRSPGRRRRIVARTLGPRTVAQRVTRGSDAQGYQRRGGQLASCGSRHFLNHGVRSATSTGMSPRGTRRHSSPQETSTMHGTAMRPSVCKTGAFSSSEVMLALRTRKVTARLSRAPRTCSTSM